MPLGRTVGILVLSRLLLLAPWPCAVCGGLARLAGGKRRYRRGGVGRGRSCRSWCRSFPQEARGAATEDAVRVADLGLAACRCARSAGGCGGRSALDVVVEAFDDVPGAGLFQVLRLDSQDVVFELLLRTESTPG